MESILISIIIPTYNRAEFIGETLDSLLAQEYKNWECLLVDDGSTDATVEILKEYASKDPRFKVFHRPESREKGANACRNIGFEKSKGDYLNWFDSDDLMHPDFISKKVDAIRNVEDSLDVLFCECQTFMIRDGEYQKIREFKIEEEDFYKGFILRRFQLSMPAGLWRRLSLEEIFKRSPFDESISQSQDYDFYFRALQHDISFGVVHEPLFSYRKDVTSISSDFKSQNIQHINSFLKVREKILNAHVEDKEIYLGVMNHVAAALRASLERKDYRLSKVYLDFLKKMSGHSPALRRDFKRISRWASICHLLGGGATRFKKKFVFGS